MKSLVFCESEPAGLLEVSLRAATLARSLGGEMTLAVQGAPEPAGLQAAQFGATGVYDIELAGYRPLALARALGQLADEIDASVVLAAGTDHGQEVMAHLAALSGEEMVANCTSVERLSQTSFRLERQRWGGSLFERARLEAGRALLTVAADAVSPVPAPGPGPAPVSRFEPSLEEDELSLVASEHTEPAAGVSLANARVVVSGGRGVGSAEGFSVIEELAGLLNGAVGVSRAVTSLGWRPHREQVGQTGTKVTPELYLACGISGAIQHLAGCQSAKTMVAINTDPDAPIMGRADFAVIGDLNEVLPALVSALKEKRASQA